MTVQDLMVTRQKVLADFGELAIRSDDLDAVLTEACHLVAKALGTSRAKVLEIQEGGQEIVMRAGVGWPAGIVGNLSLPMHEHSSETFAIKSGKPVIVQDVATEQRFKFPEFMKDAGIVALVNVPIFVPGQRPYGILQVDSSEPRCFDGHDIEFLRTYATILGPVVDRLHLVARGHEREKRLELAVDIGGIGHWDLDLTSNVLTSSALCRSTFGRADGLEFSYDDMLESIHPDDRAAKQSTITNAILLQSGFEIDCRLITPAGDIRWAELRGRYEGGTRPRLAGVCMDVTDRKRAEAELRESEERLHQFGEASQDVLWVRDADMLQWTYLTPAFEDIYGIRREEALSGDNYRSWLDMIEPQDRHTAMAAINRVRGGKQVTFEYRVRRPVDGTIRWLRDTDFPIYGSDGKVDRIGGIGQDVTDLKEAQRQIEQSEERLRSAVEVGRLGLWDWNVRTDQVHWSDEHFRMQGYRIGEIKPSFEAWFARIHPDDRAGARDALQRAMAAHEVYVHEFRTIHPDGSVHWLYGRGRFFYDEKGDALRMIGAMSEITDRREWEERQQVLIGELQHRTRNLLGVVRSISEKTARASPDLAEFRTRFRDRLDALARVQGLLSRLVDVDRVPFDELVRTELDAVDGTADRVTVEGPSGIRLRSSTVQTLAMALHELATNAVKYGALGQPSGKLAVTWALEFPDDQTGSPWLRVDWRESGVVMPAAGSAPLGTGQGRELIEQALPYQLSAKTSYRLGPDGVHCTISIPVSASTTESGHE